MRKFGKERRAEQLEKAMGYLQVGKSLIECEKLTHIENTSILREAKRRGLQKGALRHLVDDGVRLEKEFAGLSPVNEEIIRQEIDYKAKYAKFFQDATIKNVSTMMKKIDKDTVMLDHKFAQETINKGHELVIGKAVEKEVAKDSGPSVVTFNVVANDKRNKTSS